MKKKIYHILKPMEIKIILNSPDGISTNYNPSNIH